MLEGFIESQCAKRKHCAYRRNAETYRRQCVFMATTNRDQYLKDETGNRRYWPIKCRVSMIDLGGLRTEIEQVWAEVVTWYQAARKAQPRGELPLYLQDPEARRISADLQDESRTISPAEVMADQMIPWLERLHDLADVTDGADDRFDREAAGEGVQVRRNRVTALDLWKGCFHQDRQPGPADLMNLSGAVRYIPGWIKERRLIDGQRTTWFLREHSAWETDEWEVLE